MICKMTVFDKAKFHYDGDFPQNLPIEQAYVHTGLYLGWIIENKLYSKDFFNDFQQDIDLFLKKQVTGTEIYEKCDGVFASDMLNKLGNQFTEEYFDFSEGAYLEDYEEVFPEIDTLYEVKDTWENYEKLKLVINERYEGWKSVNDLDS